MQYRFTCKCEACQNDYPTIGKLQPKLFVPYANDEEDMKSLIAYDFDFALKNYRKYCEFLTKHGDAYPCLQISHVEESLKMALHILVDAVPLKARMNQIPLFFDRSKMEEVKQETENESNLKTEIKQNQEVTSDVKSEVKTN